jgi:hypothetical protein
VGVDEHEGPAGAPDELYVHCLGAPFTISIPEAPLPQSAALTA